ncbi:pseudouridine synthase [Pseudooceanicola aestuarii]|uniref:pseudouridine synthase n=1 Tax=Pseudooceanicola aestuarii TaxID=2697319 RepID=UPI0013D4D7ED|nr:pseudouridine synthase [Pseudooceanicola aestuarii]
MSRTPSRPPKPAADVTPAAATRPGERIAKVLARAGVASRREAEKMIEAGRISVNGTIIDRAALNVTDRDRVAVDGRPIDAPEPARLWLYHKPTGLVTTTKDEQGRPTIYDDLPEDLPRVMSVGRLDLNSEGLLLLTNDGGVKRKMELPSTGWMRKYRVRVKGSPTDTMLEPLRQGVVIDRESFQPMLVTLDRQQGANAWLTVGLREGRNREIRRAMEHVGLSVNRLIRISYGPFQLGQLKPGAVEEVRPRVLRDQLGEETPPEDSPPPRKRLPRKASRAGKPGAVPMASGKGGARNKPAPGKGPGKGQGQRAETEDTGRPGGKVFGARRFSSGTKGIDSAAKGPGGRPDRGERADRPDGPGKEGTGIRRPGGSGARPRGPGGKPRVTRRNRDS